MAEQHRAGTPDPTGRGVPDERLLRHLVRLAGRHPLTVLRELAWRYRMRCLNESLHTRERLLMARAPATLPVGAAELRRRDLA